MRLGIVGELEVFVEHEIGSFPLPVQLVFDPVHPYEIQLVFEKDNTWRIDVEMFRTVLADGTAGTPGTGIYMESIPEKDHIVLYLSGPKGSAEISVFRENIRDFLKKVDAMGIDTESYCISEANLNAWLQEITRDQY